MKKTLQRPAGWPASLSTPVVSPIAPSVVYASTSPDELDSQYEGRETGYTYAREGHPNADVLAQRIDALEGATGGLVVGSGMAAVSAVLLGLCKTGDHVIGADQLYGRSLRMMAEDLPRLGIATSLVDATDATAVAEAIRPETRLVLIEVVSNPTIRIADLDAVAEVCAERGVLLVVDNTFTTPLGIRPFEHGADIVLHSVTKLLAGHSDATLGWVAAKDPALAERMRIFAVTTGMTPSPFDCWLAERGLATFALRYARAQDTSQRLADYLSGAEGVKRVLYPTRPDHPEAARAQSLLKGQGGHMVSFEIEGGRAAANAFAEAASGIAFAPTLGDVGTTLSHPASSSHRALTPEARARMGVSEGFFRVSVGLEDPEALIACFADGLAAARGTA
ncbi:MULTISPECIES: trans-sulfuration enzyme family protein [Mameliella]|uniref:trans-sulfuration enzyme family protein n=1 Tax=Mameliella TaxID=1434019 RepID=UPI0008848DA0|nr:MULTISPECIES: aminotransferase class I/II-fold pyridoxal phosphate-dependent enzyme [Mameliella]MBV6638008.1 aminotransferase class I/II-fold pyridoxal phosphate-dependent enzyme [Mameliella sp.]MCR9272146.1 aminotransferase class I/II-fold pyridoxal phosphate-dependent enzyme [Paracoccaceae bacterium]MBY6119849.1 aminotransferase class I/II-fold pyridoxal phosphate-dependent enzyme [Mameliella alba]OWV45438.1 cystathionine gamma-synthase [Mameliella alba]OWV50069.1 cystathionine gamma-synt